MAARYLVEKLQKKPSDLEWGIRNHIMNLIRDGALPSPIASALCSDYCCFPCYIALELLMENTHLADGDEKGAMAVAAYLGDDKNSSVDKNDAQFFSKEREVVPMCSWKSKLNGAWKASVPPHLRRSLAVGTSPPKLEDRRTPDYVEFSLYRYPQEPNELGAPLLHSNFSNLAEGVLISRISHIYVNGRNLPVLTDVILLEMVDAPSTTLSDIYTLHLNGFVHEVEANGTWYLVRGTLFSDVELMSTCMIEAAVTVRSVVLNCTKIHHRIVSCVETIDKWLKVTGLHKKGFRSRLTSLNASEQ